MKVTHVQNQIITKTIGILFIVLFVYAATSKLLEFALFRIQLSRSPFISPYADWIAWGLPVIELFIVVLFLFPKLKLQAFYASLILMTIFTVYILIVLNFSESIPCSCGGILNNLGWKEHLIFNIAFVFLALMGILFTIKQRKLTNSKQYYVVLGERPKT